MSAFSFFSLQYLTTNVTNICIVYPKASDSLSLVLTRSGAWTLYQNSDSPFLCLQSGRMIDPNALCLLICFIICPSTNILITYSLLGTGDLVLGQTVDMTLLSKEVRKCFLENSPRHVSIPKTVY